jgi:hypothetical protein
VFKIASNSKEVQAGLKGLQKQLDFATINALTQTAKKVKQDLRESMPRYLDKPTPFTLNSLMMQPATKHKPQAKVWIKELSAIHKHYIEPQVEGGQRDTKASERRLSRNNQMPSGYGRLVPAQGAKLNQYGNLSSGFMAKVLSATKSFRDEGFIANQTRRTAKRSGAYHTFIASPSNPRTRHLKTGIYQRLASGRIKPLLIFAKQASYSKRWPFFRIAKASSDKHLPHATEAAIKQAMATAFKS